MNKSSLEKMLKPGDLVEINWGVNCDVGYFLRVNDEYAFISRSLLTDDFKVYTPGKEMERGYSLSTSDISLVKRVSVNFKYAAPAQPVPHIGPNKWGNNG
jgi:hypothetical protein